MLWKASSLGDFHLEAKDGAIGAITDCLFDETDWSVRWLVVDTGRWLPGRKVLIAPDQVDASAAERRTLALGITQEQVRESPPLDEAAPVSRGYEEEVAQHYGWPGYWMGLAYPAMPVAPEPAPYRETEAHRDPDLQSTNDVTGYHLHARDGSIGHVDDFLIDPEGWAVRYLVVDTRNWWPGKQVLVAPRALIAVNRLDRSAEVDLTKDQIREGPEYDPGRTVDRAWEERYLGYHGYPVYW